MINSCHWSIIAEGLEELKVTFPCKTIFTVFKIVKYPELNCHLRELCSSGVFMDTSAWTTYLAPWGGGGGGIILSKPLSMVSLFDAIGPTTCDASRRQNFVTIFVWVLTHISRRKALPQPGVWAGSYGHTGQRTCTSSRQVTKFAEALCTELKVNILYF